MKVGLYALGIGSGARPGAILTTKQLGAKTDRENVHAHAASLSGDKMSPFMKQNHDAEDECPGYEIEEETRHWPSTIILP